LSLQGYGTIIIKLKHKMYTNRDVAYIPDNPKNTFTGRLNKFLDATHSLHSCIKLIDQDGFQTKIKVNSVINNLDYNNIPLLLPQHTPTANLAAHKIKLSPQLIHQKCSHSIMKESNT